MTAKVLCKAHNEGLSTVDSAGKHAFDALRMMMQTRNAREKMKRGSWKVKQYRIDGALLERWFLKTLINLCLHGATPIGRDTSQPGVVPEHLVRAAYGRERLSGDAGLYSVVQAGMQISSTDSFAFAPLIKDLKHVEGGLFLFRGFCYLLFLEPDGPPHPLTGISIEGIDVGQCQLNFHNRRVTDNERGCKSQVLEVEWD
ncbi:MAG: hypothetical protein ACKVP5_06780 [Aestuariivirga sp.]